ncbi:MAG: PA2778 family cysteine peptidase [Pseudomonadota bacterium]
MACASSPQSRSLINNPPDIPQRVELTEVPFYPQQEYHCGPAAMASIFSYQGLQVEPDQIADLIYIPELQGSLQPEVVAATRQFELLPVKLDGTLESILRELAAGNPVFVLQNLGLDSIPVWHYEVVIGYDFYERSMILRSGLNPRVLRPFKVFEQTWKRAGYWALVMMNVDQIPRSVEADAYLESVIAMEQVGKIETAHRAYRTAFRRWPESMLAHSGFANTAYALGDFSSAEKAYLAALEIEPERAQLWNNYAYTLAQLGRPEAAMQAIQKALEIDPQNANLQDSLSDLKNW